MFLYSYLHSHLGQNSCSFPLIFSAHSGKITESQLLRKENVVDESAGLIGPNSLTICWAEHFLSLRFCCCPLVCCSWRCWCWDRCIYSACPHSFVPWNKNNVNFLIIARNRFNLHLCMLKTVAARGWKAQLSWAAYWDHVEFWRKLETAKLKFIYVNWVILNIAHEKNLSNDFSATWCTIFELRQWGRPKVLQRIPRFDR